MRHALTWSVSAIALTWAATAAADGPKLKGEYAFTGTAACLFAPGSSPPAPTPAPGTARTNSGFNADLTPVDGRTYSESFSTEGIQTFKGDGTGTAKGTTVGIVPPLTPQPPGAPAFPPDASSSTFSLSFTYTVFPDGTFTTHTVPGSFTGTELTGPRAGQTFTIVNHPSLTGLIGNDAKMLTLASVEPIVETIIHSIGEARPRICHRSRVLIKMNDSDRDRDR